MSTEGFTPLWLLMARFMVKQCRHCRGHGYSLDDVSWDEKGNAVTPPCPDCAELRALVEPKE